MGTSCRPIPFFSDEITIRVTEATEARHVGRDVRLRDFIGEDRAGLYEFENGEMVCEATGRRFIKGREVSV